MLELLERADLISILGPPLSFKLVPAFYMRKGRNAWHRTWSRRYFPRRVSLRRHEITDAIWRQRGSGNQGNVHSIQVFPLLQIKYQQGVVGLAALHSLENHELESIWQRMLAQSAADFWRALDNRPSDPLLLFKCDEDYEFARLYSYSRERFQNFLKLQKRLRNRIYKYRKQRL